MYAEIAALMKQAEERQASGDLPGARDAWAALAERVDGANQHQMHVHAAFNAAALDHALGRFDAALAGYRWVMARATDPTWQPRLGAWYASYAAVASIRAIAVRALRPGPDLGALLDELSWVEERAEPRLLPALNETRGQILYQVARFTDARDAFAAAVAGRRADPDSAGSSVAALLLRQAMATRDAGQRAVAETLLTEAAAVAATTTDRTNAALLRAELLITRQALAEAHATLDAIDPAELPSDEIRLRWEVARATGAAADDDLPRALALASTWDAPRLDAQPPHVRGWLWHARCAIECAAARFDAAIASAQRALALEDATRAPESRAQAMEAALDAVLGVRDLATANALAAEARELADRVSPEKRARLYLAVGRVALERGDVAAAAIAADVAHLRTPPPEVALARLDLQARVHAAQGSFVDAAARMAAWERTGALPTRVRAHGRAALRCAVAEAHLRDQLGLPLAGPFAPPATLHGDPSLAATALDALLEAASARDASLGTTGFRDHALRQHADLVALLARFGD